MKTFLITIALIFLMFSPVLAESGLNGEVWVSSIYGLEYPANPDFSSAARYSAGMELGYTFDISPFSIRPYTEINIYMDERIGFNFHPAGAQFFSGVEFAYKSFFMQLEHMCWHPIDIGGQVYQYDMVRMGIRFGK